MAVVAGLSLVVNLFLGYLLNSKPQRLVAPSGRVFHILSDLVTSDGHYFIVYDARSSPLADMSHEADELVQAVTRDTRARQLKTIGVEASQQIQFGLFRFGKTFGFIYERQGDQWLAASREAIDAHLRASVAAGN